MGSISTTIKKDPNNNTGNQKQQEQPNSPFDRLPDDVILIIIKKIRNARTLIRCLTLNKRFASIVPQTDAVLFPLYVSPRPRQNNTNTNTNSNNNNSNTSLTRGNPVNILRSVVDYIITNFLRRNNRRDYKRRRLRRAGSGCLMTGSLCQQCPPKILRTFRNITDLNLKLHTYGGAVDNIFLKWKASYAGELKTCVIICATSFRRYAIDESQPAGSDADNSVPPPPPSLPNEEFKSRIMWTISCLIAASARHFLLKQVLAEFPNVKKARITDARRQGKLRMVEDEIEELRESLKEEGALELSAKRVVPDLRMRMWYVPDLDLPESRCEMKGATLLVVGPASGKEELVPPPEMYGKDGGYDGNAAEKAVFAEAEREIVNIKKRSTYVMEMTSF